MSVDIRCDCSKRPMLAVAGVADDGKPYVHVKAHKQKQIIAEVVALSGDVRIRCRFCLRWHRIFLRLSSVDATPERLPEGISLQ